MQKRESKRERERDIHEERYFKFNKKENNYFSRHIYKLQFEPVVTFIGYLWNYTLCGQKSSLNLKYDKTEFRVTSLPDGGYHVLAAKFFNLDC